MDVADQRDEAAKLIGEVVTLYCSIGMIFRIHCVDGNLARCSYCAAELLP